MLWDVNVRYGRERAAAKVAEVEDAEDGLDGEVAPPTAVDPCFGFWRCNCRALASAFSCVRTKYARLYAPSVPNSSHVTLDGGKLAITEPYHPYFLGLHTFMNIWPSSVSIA